jgi:hypothetical protein
MSAGRGRARLLWVLAVFLMLGSAVYQRLTGPTNPLRVALTVGGEDIRFRLPRSGTTDGEVRVAVPSPREGATATLWWRRYPTGGAPTQVPMRPDSPSSEADLVAHLPVQPAAGKLEYWIEITSAQGMWRIPSQADQARGEGTIVLRYKDPVPGPLLGAHVAFMFFAILIGMRAGLGALFGGAGVRTHSWIALGLMTVGGMILGPFVQKYAFGEYWTGFPFGYDLTDNKTLIMWLAWIVACGALARAAKTDALGLGRRAVVVAAAIVMSVVYLIPHSLRGSELDYELIDQGVAAEDAIGVGN